MTTMVKHTQNKSENEAPTNRVGLLSDVGKKREIDEDSILAIECLSVFESKESRKFVLVLADGMGGHAKGEVASKITVTTVAEKLIPNSLLQNNYASEIKKAIQEANQKILQYSLDNSTAEGIGSTIVCAIVDGNNIHLGNVGDSRAYLISKDEIRQITKDHSYVQELIDKGEIAPEESISHPKKNVITRALGIYAEVEVDTMKLTKSDDEILLLCCDGLIIHVNDEEIKDIVTSENPQDACKKLVDLANKRGGKDNISVIILH